MTLQILILFFILIFTVLLLSLDLLRMDIAAMLIMLILVWSQILEPTKALSGFSSNTVISLIAVMILGRGIAHTGIMERFSDFLLLHSDSRSRSLVLWLSLAVGVISAFIQNLGAFVLFMPAILEISRHKNIPASRLLIPVGFASILGGNLSMVGAGPLLMVNDFLSQGGYESFGLFAVTPVGISLLIVGLLLFFFFSNFLLPKSSKIVDKNTALRKQISWHIPDAIYYFRIPQNSPLIGANLEELHIWDEFEINLLGTLKDGLVTYAPPRETCMEPGLELALMGDEDTLKSFAVAKGLEFVQRLEKFECLHDPSQAGFAELMIPPRSLFVGQRMRDYKIRKRFAVEPILLYHKGERYHGDLSDFRIKAGDILVVHGLWENIVDLRENDDFILIMDIDYEKKDASKTFRALASFILAILLSFTGMPVSIAFLTGALAMVFLKVISVEEIYKAVNWKVIFFMAGLIPLGLAMQETGTAAWLASLMMGIVEGHHPLYLLTALAVMGSFFSLFMSNVVSTIILAPLVINIAQQTGMDPAPLVLLVAVSSSNSFILPTHQVNALYKSSGGYRNSDFVKAGSLMTLLYIAITVSIFYLFYL
ncbi:MAG: SLC13 family permease [Anaerolineales bacterium]|nr:SLC13 family permease [Anaerolineales bacterium]